MDESKTGSGKVKRTNDCVLKVRQYKKRKGNNTTAEFCGLGKWWKEGRSIIIS